MLTKHKKLDFLRKACYNICIRKDKCYSMIFFYCINKDILNMKKTISPIIKLSRKWTKNLDMLMDRKTTPSVSKTSLRKSIKLWLQFSWK